MTLRSRARLVVVATGTTLLAACSSGSPGSSGSSAVTPSAPAVTTASVPPSTTTGQKAPDLSKAQTMATGLDVPWGLAFLPDSSALVNERGTAKILRIPAGGGTPKQVYKMPGVQPAGEGGLLGLAVDPQYATNHRLYAYFTAAEDNRIVRFSLDDGGKPTVILDGIDKNTFHNGGRLAFGPDGMLYAGTGDAGDRPEAQNKTDLNGKILRMTTDGKPAPGNPFAGSQVWSMGHRNVQGLAWAADGTMYGIEFGQDTWDEVNIIKPGKNYGWPDVEGRAGNPKYEDPIVQWHTDDASPSGAAISGRTLYVAGLKGERLWTVPLDGGSPKAELTGKYGRLRTVAVAPDGALWLTTSNKDGRGDPKSGDDKVLRFPAA
jgi:glucose/arabinose dehydrogenase